MKSQWGFGGKYNEVESVLESGEEEDIFSPEYFEKLSDVKMPATKLELLIKMLRKQIKEYGKINQIAAKTFQEIAHLIYHAQKVVSPIPLAFVKVDPSCHECT